MKLKTLKDLKFMYHAEGERPYPLVMAKELKAEAMNWVKYLIKKRGIGGADAYDVLWIKHFFNITEEDLSQGMTQEVPK